MTHNISSVNARDVITGEFSVSLAPQSAPDGVNTMATLERRKPILGRVTGRNMTTDGGRRVSMHLYSIQSVVAGLRRAGWVLRVR